MENLVRYGLLIYLVVNFGLTFVLPSYRVWKQTGIFPVTFGKTDNAHDFIGRIFKILLVIILIVCAAYTFFPSAIPFLVPIQYLEIPPLQAAGLMLMFLALIWISVAQFQMGNSWRIGIDEKNATTLVTTGVFAISRNPIFLGMLTTLTGLFLVIPNAATLAVYAVAFAIVQIQVRLEEEFLQKIHSETYHDYCQKTRRWL